MHKVSSLHQNPYIFRPFPVASWCHTLPLLAAHVCHPLPDMCSSQPGSTDTPSAQVLEVYVGVIELLGEATRSLPAVDAAGVDAGWKRCKDVRLPQNLARVHVWALALNLTLS